MVDSIDVEGVRLRNPIPPAARIGPVVATSALTGRAPDGTMPTSLDDQCANAFRQLRIVLAAAGGTSQDVLRLTVHLADPHDRTALNREWLALYPDEAHRPARHVVAATLADGARIQLEALAIVPVRRDLEHRADSQVTATRRLRPRPTCPRRSRRSRWSRPAWATFAIGTRGPSTTRPAC